MRINGTAKSFVANHLAESVSGAITIRAFNGEECFSAKNFQLVDTNATPYFHSYSANEWLIQRLEIISAAVLASAALCMVVLPHGTFTSGGHKIGKGSEKSTLIGALFRLVEQAGGKTIVNGIDICTIGLHDLRSRFGIMPQDPTLFNGTVRYNLDSYLNTQTRKYGR
ncbi:hypothetical protein ACLB2K_075633 [Fragaria x ananassa]